MRKLNKKKGRGVIKEIEKFQKVLVDYNFKSPIGALISTIMKHQSKIS